MASQLTQPTHVRDVMTKEPICFERDHTIQHVARTFEEFEISGGPVLESDGRLVGVVTKSDLIRRCTEGFQDQPPGYLFERLSEEAGEDVDFAPEQSVVVQDFMSADPLTATADEPIGAVARRLAEARMHRAIVVDDEQQVVGIVTSLDILKAFPQ